MIRAASPPLDHDRWFKELITTFFLDLITLFYPRLAREIEPDSLEFLPQEVFTNQREGREYVTDILVKARFRGREACFLIHVEHQSTAGSGFPARFFIYYCVLSEKYRLPIYPIALFSHDKPLKRQPDTYRVRFPDGFGNVFRFRVIQLNRLPWRKFVKSANPIASALMAKMRIAERDRPKVKLECLRLMVTLKLDPARMKLIGSFVDAYLRLNPREDEVFREQVRATRLAPKEKKKVLDYVTSWEEAGIEKGLQRGLKQGRQEGREEGLEEGLAKAVASLREGVVTCLTQKFGPLKPALAKRIHKVDSLDQLQDLLKQALTVSRLSDFRI